MKISELLGKLLSAPLDSDVSFLTHDGVRLPINELRVSSETKETFIADYLGPNAKKLLKIK